MWIFKSHTYFEEKYISEKASLESNLFDEKLLRLVYKQLFNSVLKHK